MATSYTIRRLGPDDAAAFRAIRLEGLERSPEAFASSVQDEAGRDLAWFAARLQSTTVMGGFGADGGLAGVMAFYVDASPKLRHKAQVWGVYLRPAARGTGLACALLAALLEAARPDAEAVRLQVVASNARAVRLYERAGFRRFGLEPHALKLGDTYYDELLMGLAFDPPP